MMDSYQPSYQGKRAELSKKYKMTRVPRAQLRDFRGHEGEAKYLVGEYKDISSPRVVHERKSIVHNFPNAIIDVHKYNGIDQGQNGACSMVAIFNAFELHGHTKHFLKVPYPKIKRNWRKYWKPPMQIGNLDASGDLGEALDMISKPIIKSHIGLVYMPLRSADQREQCFNEKFWVNDEDFMVRRYNIPQGQYAKMKHIYEIAFYIEKQIDNGIPVVVNVNEHCRVAVGYNESKILFADSWDRKYTQRNKSGSSVNIAGLSFDCKWMVYCWARDLVTFNFAKRDSPEGAAADASSSRKTSKAQTVLDLTTDRDEGSSETMQRARKRRKRNLRDDRSAAGGEGGQPKREQKSSASTSSIDVDLTFDDDAELYLTMPLTERLMRRRQCKE